MTDLIGGYLKEIEKLKARLIESEQMYQQLKKTVNNQRVKNSIPFANTNGKIFIFFLYLNNFI